MIRIAYVCGRKQIYGLSDSQLNDVKSSLTFLNPQWVQIQKYSRWGNTRVNKFVHYYTLGYYPEPYIAVPMGYVLPFGETETIISDDRLSLDVDYPDFELELREIQEKATNEFEHLGTLVLPTGCGKSICGLYLAGKLKQRALIVVNKDDLVDGWIQDAKLCYKDLDIGLVKGQAFKIGKHITLTTIQTLSRLGEKKLYDLYSNISMLIADEVHHAGAKSYEVLNTFRAKYRLGLTATKMRNDGLVDVVDHICGKTVFDGTSFVTDVIIPPENIHIIRKNSNVFWKPEKSYYDTMTKATVHNIIFDDIEYIEGTVEWRNLMERLEAEGKVKAYSLRLHKAYELIANNETFNALVCRDIIENYNKGKSCVVFCKTVEQLNNLYELLKGRCPKIQKFYGNMKDTKAEVKRRAESKEVLITLATISIACEGTNVKAWECGFLVSSVANEKDLIQILGRLRRTTEGKTDVYFYDYRHPQVVGIKKHGYERDNWYKNLKIKS